MSVITLDTALSLAKSAISCALYRPTKLGTYHTMTNTGINTCFIHYISNQCFDNVPYFVYQFFIVTSNLLLDKQ